MNKTSVNFRVSVFRHRVFVWILLFFFSWSFIPSVSMAQQPTATISSLSGTVLVDGQEQGKGTVLNAGDVIETQAGASVVLELSDGSLLELGETTKVDLAELAQIAAGARVSRMNMWWGRIRAQLSAGHQEEGSSFQIETPNAVIGVKFSQPDVEVSYDLEKQETIGIAHTVELIATNLLSGEKKIIPVGSTVIIIGMMMKVVAGTTAAAIAAESATGGTTTSGTATAGAATAGTAAAGAATAGTTTAGTATAGAATAAAATGVSAATIAAVGLGVAAVGGVVAVAASSGGDSSSGGNYTVSDLQGSWTMGFVFNTGLSRSGPISFDSQGNVVDFSGPANLISSNGSFTVSANNVVEGTLSFQAGYDPEQPCFGSVGTTTMNLQGNFVSQNRIEGTLTGSDTSTCPDDPPENFTGTFTMTR